MGTAHSPAKRQRRAADSSTLPLSRKIRYALEYAAAAGILKLMGALSRPLAHIAGALVGGILYHTTPKLRRTADRNLQMAMPQFSRDERAAVCRGVYRSLGRLLAACALFPRMTPENIGQSVDYDGLSNYQDAVARQRGVLFLTAHLGAWELGAFAHAFNGYPLCVLYRRLDNPWLDRLVNRYRSMSGNTLIDKNESAREMLAALSQGKTVGILADQNTLQEEAVFVDFFGVQAASTAGIAKIALRTGAAVVPAFCVWNEESGKFRIIFDEPLKIENTGNAQQDVVQATQQMARVIEKYVRKYPAQWLWIHRRWKTRPPGQPPLY